MSRPAHTVAAILALALCPVAPLGAQAAPAAPAAAASATPAAPRARTSWISDRRDFAVGDIITVLLDESTRSSAVKGQVGTDEQSRDLRVGIEPPKIGEDPMSDIDARVSTGNRASSRQTGESLRDVRFLGDISVRVVAVDARGQLQVKGTKLVEQDKVKQAFEFSGVVRPQDVTRANVVESARVADAKLVYELKGNLGKTRGGIVGRVLGMVWP